MAHAIIAVTKICSACKQTLPLSKFGISTMYKDGRRGQCTPCRGRLRAEYLREHPEKRTKPNPETQKKYKQKPEVAKRSLLMRRYGMTVSEYHSLLESQGGRCAICGVNSGGGRWGTFQVDHCHQTGLVRGILCNDCNVALGRVGDNMAGIMRFVRYLEKSASSDPAA